MLDHGPSGIDPEKLLGTALEKFPCVCEVLLSSVLGWNGLRKGTESVLGKDCSWPFPLTEDCIDGGDGIEGSTC